jgi:hypothetical protein
MCYIIGGCVTLYEEWKACHKCRNHQEEAMYETPDIMYEGDLEVQAGSPIGVPIWDDLEDL